MRDRAPTSRGEVHDALTAARRTATSGAAGPAGRVLALQRRAGNAAVSALLAAKLKAPGGEAVGKIDAALREVDGSDPDVGKVEAGLKEAKAAGVPVDIDGAEQKPPASALAVTTTGFGPGQVKPQPPPPPKKPVPAKSPLAKVAKKAPPVGPAKKGGAPAAPKPAGPAPAAGAKGAAPAPLSGDQLLQPPVPPTPAPPEADPAFAAVTAKAGAVAKAKKAHPPASAKAKEAQEAAVAPADDTESQAKAAKADTMDAQQPGSFDKKAFIAAVKAAIEAKSPKNLEEADEYKKSGKAEEVKGDVQGMVGQGKQEQAKDITEATEAAPDPSKAVQKPVTPMQPEPPGPVGTVPAAGAAPKPAPAEQVNLEAGKHQANQEMADADVDEKQLAESNEPEFNQALADKKQAAQHADTAPGEYRKAEQETIAQSKAEASATTAAAVTGMHGAKTGALAALVADKQKTKSKDEQKRAEVTAKIKSIYDATEADVKKILDGIDPKVEEAFGKGEQKARQEFEAFVAQKMAAYKKDRYGGWLGGLKWAKDKLFGMPDKVNEFFQAGRELYLKRMDDVISGVAEIVGGDLTKAKQRIAQGRQEIASYVKSLPADLQKVGSEAASEIGEKFDQLTEDVNSKQDALVDTLATKYTEARQGLDARIEELQAENKGLVDKAIGAIKAVINTIRELASMLKNVLARAAGVVGDIIKAPVAFLGNLIAGVKGGILRFKDNILDHLKKGLMGWLFGALAEGGVEMPETFDLKGIIKLLASIFGLTWRNIRNRLVKQIGEPAMAAVEKGVDIFQKLGSQGVAGLWDLLLEKLGDIKEMILEKVKDFVVTRIITAGITWLIGLLNPAAAFIKACKLIYDVVMFFVQNASRIMKFVNTILDSVADIVRGNVGSVVAKIEDVLGQMVPILIGFLASVIGLGGIGQKVREIVQTLQKPVNKALDFVIKQGLKLAGPIIRGLKGIGAKAKAKVAAGKAWVKGKTDAVKAKVKAKASAARDRLTGRGDPAATAKAVANAAKGMAGRPNAVEQVRSKANAEAARRLGGQGTVKVSGVPVIQRTRVDVTPGPPLPAPEELPVRSAHPTKVDSAASILELIKSRMPTLLKAFEKDPASKRAELDRLEREFRKFMQGKRGRALTARERNAALAILGPARSKSREYYGRFRDFAWTRLNKDPQLLALVKKRDSGAKAGGGKEALKIEVVVTRADGSQATEFRSVDFEHITRVTDQPFRKHSEGGGKNANLTPMLADLNRYYQEALRNLTGAHMFGGDEVEQFIVEHQLYPEQSPASREIGFQPADGT